MIKKQNWQKSVVFLLAVFIGISLLASGCGQSHRSTSKAGAAASPQAKLAAQRGYILVGLPVPMTGPLASFGEGMQWVADRALAAINKNGGVEIKSLGKKLPVKVKIMDTQSSPTVAAQVTSELVVKDKVNMLLVLWTPDVVNPVTSMAERYKIPTVALQNPIEAWLTGGPYHWSYLVGLPVTEFLHVYVDGWNKVAAKTDKVVGLLFPNDADGVSWAKVFNQQLPKMGYKVVDPGRFLNNTNDFTAIITQFKKDHVDIVTGTMVPPVFATVWRQMHEQGFTPKIATIGKALLFPTDVDALGGNLPEGLTTESWWSDASSFKSSLTGETAKEFTDAWTKATGKQPMDTISSDYAGFGIVANVLNRAGSLNPEKLREAIAQTNLTTIIGPVKFNSQHYAVTPLALTQWVKGTKWPWEEQVVNDQLDPNLPVTAKMVFPLPK